MQRTIRLGSFKKFKAAAGPLAIRTWHWRGGIAVSACSVGRGLSVSLKYLSRERETRLLERVRACGTVHVCRQAPAAEGVPTLHLQATRHLCRALSLLLRLACVAARTPLILIPAEKPNETRGDVMWCGRRGRARMIEERSIDTQF